MSALRRTDGRAQARKTLSSPYARPRALTSGWSFSKLIEPLRRVFGHQEEDEESFSRPVQFAKSPSPEDFTDLEERGDQLRAQGSLQSIITEAEPPRSTTTSPKREMPAPGSNATETLERVIEFLTDVAGTALRQDEARQISNLIQQAIPGEKLVSQTLTQNVGRIIGALEVEGSISVLQRAIVASRPEPFRFQSVALSRDASPAPPPSTTNKPRRTLKSNPNGTYRWNGAGSAKQTKRNRYSSPAFGTAQITPEKPKTDGKRRKLDDSNSSPPSNDPITSPQTSRANGSTPPKLNITTPSPSRLRTPSVAKPTTPSQPSPLRQAWQLSPTSSHESLEQSSPPPAPQPSETANLMSQLIKQATPPKKPDLSNPYQTASPTAKVGPPRRSTRRTKPAPRPEEVNGKTTEEQGQAEQMKDIPAQAIIEATVPKGSKRARPPTNGETSSSAEPSGSSSKPSKVSFALDDDDLSDSERSNKKAKGVSSCAPETKSKDVQMSNGTSGDKPPSNSISAHNAAPPARPAFNSLKSATAPSRPSNLRFSYQPEGSSTPSSPNFNDKEKEKSQPKDAEMSAPPPPTTTSTFGSLPSVSATITKVFSTPPIPEKPKDVNMGAPQSERIDPKAEARRTAKLPTFTFTMSVCADTRFLKAQADAKSTLASSLPKFDFTLTASSSTSSSSSTWTCSLCMLTNPGSATDKCTICEAERPGSAFSAPTLAATKSFDWSAAGMKAPSAASGADWTCSQCMLSNPASASDKCTICEAERPGAAKKAAAPEVKAFDWSAAGLAPPAPPTDKWSCGTCMCSNPKDAAKCVVCETPR